MVAASSHCYAFGCTPSVSTMFRCIIVALTAVAATIVFRTKRLPLPPGPRGSYFLGVVCRLSPVEPWKQYAAWARQYGGSLLSFRVYNRQVIILNNNKAVRDLLDKRANIYSDRTKSWMFHELCGRGNTVFNISSTNDRHRQYRKILAQGLGLRAMETYWHTFEAEVGNMLEGIKNSPSQFQRHLRRYAAAVILRVTYGYEVADENDPFISVAEDSAKISGMALAPGWLVDYYPIVRFIPSWLPFAKFKRQAREWRIRLESLSDVTHQWVKTQMASGSYTESFTSNLLKPEGSDLVSSEQEDVIKWCAGGLYAGATDTVISATTSFVLLMALHPEIQAAAQREIDHVVGREPPTVPDLAKLTYLSAVFKEVLRYAPVANLALPHNVTQEDEYDGYRIPEGSSIIPNVWAIMHDPDLYPDPDRFDPSRFKSKNGSRKVNPDPKAFAFGFGRRTCPGILFAETSVLLTVASILSQFTICLPEGAVINQPQFTTGITSHIKPFNVDFVPR